MIDKSPKTAEEVKERACHGNFDRKWSMFDLSTCDHPSPLHIVYVNDWEITICPSCATILQKKCEHKHCEWEADGTLLRCTTCGIDGT